MTRSPDDPAFPGLRPDDCFLFDEECEFGIQNVERPRATAMKLFADEMGVDFPQVLCRVEYVRIYSRQEAYDEACGSDDVISQWAGDNNLKLRITDWEWVDTEGVVHPVPEGVEIVPDDWEPDDTDPVWAFCKKTDPGAVKVWRLDVKPHVLGS
jgi:hypothetical protein